MTESSNALPEVGEQVALEIDWDRRYRLMRMHSCMHMLCALVPAPVTGGSISDGRGRLDFDLPDPLDKEALTRRLNQLIREGHSMRLRWITAAQLRAQPELVRTMSASPPQGTGKIRLVDFAGVDIQPCGGTHVANSAEIGPVRVTKIEKKGRQNRRVIVVFAEAGGPDLGTE
jgi:misacylated tRNA(Ala) deacylase